MNQKHLLRFIKKKMKTESETVVHEQVISYFEINLLHLKIFKIRSYKILIFYLKERSNLL